jgi:DNA-directed RNA polymerase subunit M/transcription elongation factor TFIIS
MPPNLIDEEYCPKCSTMLNLITRTKEGEDMTETYYCGRCSQEYTYQYEFKDIIKR